MTQEAPKNKNEGLTPEQIAELEKMRTFLTLGFGDSAESAQFIEFQIEHMRLWYLLEKSLTEIKESNPRLFYAVLIAARADMQGFYNLINAHLESNPVSQGTELLLANQTMNAIKDLQFSGLFTNDGYSLRESLIRILSEHPDAKKVVAILKQLQLLMPELLPGQINKNDYE